MDILYLLIPLSLVAMFGVLGVFAWALHGGQFDDMQREAERIVIDGDDAVAVAAPVATPVAVAVAVAAPVAAAAAVPVATPAA